jgi:hypothetical protein
MRHPQKSLKYPILIICIMTLCSGSPKPFFEQKWNQDFHLRQIESGDTLSIGSVFSDGSSVFINDRAAGTMVILDRLGKKKAMVALEGIGRDTYCGDDFIVKDSSFIFVNTVDKRLECFSLGTGKHQSSLPLPSQALSSYPKRSWRLIDRIEVIDGAVQVGNAHLLFDLKSGLKKPITGDGILKAPDGGRFALVNKEFRLYQKGNTIIGARDGKIRPLPLSRYTIPGKRLFSLNGRLYAVIAAAHGVKIVELR